MINAQNNIYNVSQGWSFIAEAGFVGTMCILSVSFQPGKIFEACNCRLNASDKISNFSQIQNRHLERTRKQHTLWKTMYELGNKRPTDKIKTFSNKTATIPRQIANEFNNHIT